MFEKRIWPVEQLENITAEMDYVVKKALNSHQVQINMILIAELEGGEMTFNYNFVENFRKVDFQKLLEHTFWFFQYEVNKILSPEPWIHISKVSHWKYLVIHRDVDFWDIVWWQYTQRAIHSISNDFYQIFHPLLPQETLMQEDTSKQIIPDNVYSFSKVA